MTDAWAGSVCHQYGVALNPLTLVEMNFHSCRKFYYYSNILGIRLPFMYLIAKPKTWESNSFSYIIYSLPFFKKTIRDLNISDFILFCFVLFCLFIFMVDTITGVPKRSWFSYFPNATVIGLQCQIQMRHFPLDDLSERLVKYVVFTCSDLAKGFALSPQTTAICYLEWVINFIWQIEDDMGIQVQPADHLSQLT